VDRIRKTRIFSGMFATIAMGLCQCSLFLDLSGIDVPSDSDGQAGDGGVAEAAPEGSARDSADGGDDRAPAVDASGDDGWEGAAEASGDGGADAADGTSEGATGAPDGGDDAAVDAADSGDGGDAGAADSAGDAASDACTLVTHSNGVGQAWQDCLPLGTYTRAEADSACAACSSTGCARGTGCNLQYMSVTVGTNNYYWVYAVSGSTAIAAGDVLEYPTGTAVSCQNVRASQTWQ
jgi:hypothetical protein